MLFSLQGRGLRSAAALLLAFSGLGGAVAQSNATDNVLQGRPSEGEPVVLFEAQPSLFDDPAHFAKPDAVEAAQVIGKGMASWYGGKFHGRPTASGEPYDKNALTAAHKTLPFGSLVRVKSERTGKEVVVRINDRGPYKRNRLIDLSGAAAAALGIKARGVSNVILLRE